MHLRLPVRLSSVNLLVASLDLKLVRLLREAMRAADDRGGVDRNSLIGPAAMVEPRPQIRPEPVVEPRLHHHPEPVFEPRPVHRPAEPSATPPTCGCPASAELPRAEVKLSGSPIQPPWKVLPWQNPPAERPRPVQKVKLVIGRPDICNKGGVIDFFI